jgi:aspartate/methionine/tyrosine aminotransferase
MARVSPKALGIEESVIRYMSREAVKHGAVNLSQGFPDFEAPHEIKQAAIDAINQDHNQYAVTWGVKEFRDAIAGKTKKHLGLDVDPEEEITVTCGSTEGMIAAMLATVTKGDEVILFEPFYENYAPDAILSDATPVHVPLYQRDGGWFFDHDELRSAFGPATKAIIICNPNNPTGKVFTLRELQIIADLCIEFDALCFTDEIYEHIVFDDPEGTSRQHVCMATLPGMKERTVVINSLSKTYSVTGWRVGYCIAPPDITLGIRKVHDFLTVGAPNPLQRAGAFAMTLPDSYYASLKVDYERKRSILIPALNEVGLTCEMPEGAYYVMTDISRFGFANDTEFVMHLIREIGVAAVPGSSFFSRKDLGTSLVRFCFCKKDETLFAAAERLSKLSL